MLLQDIIRNWWTLALRGLIAIIFGIMALVWPSETLVVLVVLFGVYALVDGIFAIITGAQIGSGSFVLEGILGIIAGVLTFLWPGTTALALLWIIALWAIFTGIVEIVSAVQLRKIIKNEFLMILGGILSIAFGVLLFMQPEAGALSVVWIIGIYALVFGVLFISLGFRLRGIGHRMERSTQREVAMR
jgi:uncharacterized membrane protein HdeD (DUF308 family)